MAHNFYVEKYEEIVKCLGGINPEKEETFYQWNFTYRGFEMALKPNKDKIQVTVFTPRHEYNANTYEAKKQWLLMTTSINIDNKFPAEDIAEKIKKRIDFDELEKIRDLYKKADEEYDLAKKRHKDLVDKINEFIKGRVISPSEMSSEISIFDKDIMYGSVFIQGDSVEFRIRGLKSFEIIEKICKAIR